jgi:hypothetical protein
MTFAEESAARASDASEIDRANRSVVMSDGLKHPNIIQTNGTLIARYSKSGDELRIPASSLNGLARELNLDVSSVLTAAKDVLEGWIAKGFRGSRPGWTPQDSLISDTREVLRTRAQQAALQAQAISDRSPGPDTYVVAYNGQKVSTLDADGDDQRVAFELAQALASAGDEQAQADLERGQYLANRYLVPAMIHNRNGALSEPLARALDALRVRRQGGHRP